MKTRVNHLAKERGRIVSKFYKQAKIDKPIWDQNAPRADSAIQKNKNHLIKQVYGGLGRLAAVFFQDKPSVFFTVVRRASPSSGRWMAMRHNSVSSLSCGVGLLAS
jgi:hypothetical protein